MKSKGLMISALTVVLAQGIHIPSAKAEFYTGNKIYEFCKSAADFSNGVCAGYIVGVLAGVEFVEEVTKAKETICLPESATAGQVRDVVIRYLDVNPEKRHLRAAPLVWSALAAGFPCKK